MPNSRTQKWLRVFFNPFPPSYVTRNNSFTIMPFFIIFYFTIQKKNGNFNPKSNLKIANVYFRSGYTSSGSF